MTENVVILLAVYFGTLFLAAFIMMPIEGWRFIEGLWWAHVTSLTIGFGDLAPKTDTGRMIAMVFDTFWALYFLLCLGAHIIRFFFRDKNEMTHEEQEWIMDGLVMEVRKLNGLALHNKAFADHFGIVLDMSAFINPDGSLIEMPPQPADTSHGNIKQKKRRLAARK